MVDFLRRLSLFISFQDLNELGVVAGDLPEGQEEVIFNVCLYIHIQYWFLALQSKFSSSWPCTLQTETPL